MNGEPSSPRRRDAIGFVIAAVLLLFALVIGWDATSHEAGPAYSRIGPEAASYVVAAGLALLGLSTAVAAWRGDFPEPEPYDLSPALLILAGLAALIAAIAFGGGFIIGATVLFAATARAFSRDAPLADLIIGLGLSFLVYLAFAKLLSLSLPQGPIERLL